MKKYINFNRGCGIEDARLIESDYWFFKSTQRVGYRR